MRWILALAALGVLGLLVVDLVRRHRGSRRAPSRGTGGYAWLILTVAALVSGIYLAHLLGIFSIPLVALGFVTIGICLRWWFLATRTSRGRQAEPGTPWGLGRLPAAAEIPVLVALVLAVIAIGLVTATMVGPH
jgi:hypothetical protein